MWDKEEELSKWDKKKNYPNGIRIRSQMEEDKLSKGDKKHNSPNG
jgi:hypothetical protein